MTTLTTYTRRTEPQPRIDWVQVARDLAPGFASRAAAYDANDSFPFENYAELKQRRVFSAGIPVEFGGGGADVPEICAMLRELGRACGSTALALSMHLHLVATLVWSHRQGAPVGPVLEQIAAGQLVLVTSGASDWLDSSGTAQRVEGGFRVSARKAFASGAPAGDLFVSSAVYDDPVEGPTVLHFTIPLRSPGVTMLDTWRTMGMRGTGSHDIVLDGVFVPDQAVASRRAQGSWPAVFNALVSTILSMIMSVYLGVADAARAIALEKGTRRAEDAGTWYLLGEMETAFVTGRMAVENIVALTGAAPGLDTVNEAGIRKTIAAGALTLAVEKALEVSGGSGIYRSAGLERLVRDIHAVQFHPFQAKRQHRFTGRLLLGLDPVG